MAAAKKIGKEGILEAAYRLVRKEGIDALSARKLAQEASCSTQPIYENFGDMGAVIELTKERMSEAANLLRTDIEEHKGTDYSQCGKIFCEFAMKEKMLFRHYVTESGADKTFVNAMSAIRELTEKYGCNRENAAAIDKELTDYILGKAFLINSGYEEFSEEKVQSDIQNYQAYIIQTFVK